MKKLYYVRTNGYDMLLTYDPEEKIVRFLNTIDVTDFLGHLDLVEDDSSWETVKGVENFEEWIEIGKGPESPEILDALFLNRGFI